MQKKWLWAGAILLAAVACRNPLQDLRKSSDSETRSLSLRWQVTGGAARTLYPASYPMPTSYDVVLQPSGGGSAVSRTGLTGTSWTVNGLEAALYTIQVTGKDGSGNPIVSGDGSADLRTVGLQSPTIPLYYIATGEGTGRINLTFDTNQAGFTTVSNTEFTLVNPSGGITADQVKLSGSAPTFTYTKTEAQVGTYKMFAKLTGTFTTGGEGVAMRNDTIIVVQNVDTTAKITLTAADCTAKYVPVEGLSLDVDTMALVGGTTGSLTATLSPTGASNTLVAWTTDKASVATVNQSGLVTAKGAGTATITATSVEKPSCSDSCTVTVQGGAMYVVAAGNVYAYHVDSTGALQTPPFDTCSSGTKPWAVVITPNHKYLYVTNNTTSTVSEFAIETTGALQSLGDITTGTNPRGLAVTPDGKYLYVANFDNLNGHTISGFSIGKDGTLSLIDTYDTSGTGANVVAVSPNGFYLYVGNYSTNDVTGFTIGSDGTLTRHSNKYPTGQKGSNGLAISPDGNYLYVTNNTSYNITGFTIGTDGALTLITGSPYGTGGYPAGVSISPNGKYLYVANQSDNSVSCFAIGTGGTLSSIGSPVTAGTYPQGTAISPDGRYLYVTNSNNDTISGFTVNTTTGTLSTISGSPFSTGDNPVGVVILFAP